MKKIIAATLSAVAIIAACASCTGQSSTQANQAQTEAASGALSIDQLIDQAESLAGQSVTIEGVCTHTCKHGATKIFLQGSDRDHIVRCEAGALGAFSKECVRNVVRVTGIVRESRIDEAYLQQWQARYAEAMAQQASAAALNGEAELDDEAAEKAGTSAGCATESAARHEQGNTIEEKVAAYREQIAQRLAKEGKDYLSFYHVEATSYEIVDDERQ